jgi:ribose transport system ATP-binding protein
MALSERVLEMRGVEKRFGSVVALAGVDLDLDRGEVHALIGENGAGKSTLMKILSGALRPDRGTISLEGRRYDPSHPRDAFDRGVAMIYQELSLAPHLSVEDNVALGRERHRFGIVQRRPVRDAVKKALEELGHADIEPGAIVAELGPGLRQVVEIARALVANARIVVMDEPTSSLARGDVEKLFETIDRLRARGISIIYISHFLDELERIADRYTVLRDGRTVRTGVLSKDGSRSKDERPVILEAMVGRAIDEVYPSVPHERGEPILTLEALASARVPKSASLTLHRGEIFGVAGLVGAGRTELFRAIYGLAPVTRGTIRVAAFAPDRGRTPAERVAQKLGFLSEDRAGEGLARDLSIADNIVISKPVVRRGLFVSRSKQIELARGWMKRLAVRARDPEQRVGDLSGGNQQKVAFARLLHQEADVLLLDEPTRGIDVGSKLEIYGLIGELAAQGKAVLIVSSQLPELLGVCDRIAVMHRGVLGEARETAEWTETALLAEATSGATA